MCREAAFIALREDFNCSAIVCIVVGHLVYPLIYIALPQTMAHFMKAFDVVKQTIKQTTTRGNKGFEFTAPVT